MTLTKDQSTWLKLLAVLFMIIDHIGVVMFPEDLTWRMIGRLAFPLFAYQLAIGFAYSKNHTVQLKYLMLFAMVSQIPFAIVTGVPVTSWHLNIFVTFTVAYALMMLWEKVNKIVFVTALLLVLLLQPPVDYGWYGILLPLGFYVFRKHPIGQIGLLLLATFVKSVYGSPVQAFAVFSLFVLMLLRIGKMPHVTVSKWFFYWFYPVHLAVLAVIKLVWFA